MSWSDPVADMLTRIRNAYSAEHEIVEIPHSKLKGEIARILKKEGFITDYVTEGGMPKVLRLYLKYGADGTAALRGLRRKSKPGLRDYVSAGKLPRILSGMGIAILSTSSGIMTDKDARKQNVGGEYLCSVW